MKSFTSGRLPKIALGVSIVWVIAQIVLIAYFWGYPQKDDAGAYISRALNCFNNKEWYPMMEDVYSTYIVTPGLINFLILQLRIFGTVNFNAILNLFLNIALLLEVYYLGKKFFSERIGLISVIIFCLLYSNLFIVLGANTENSFLFLCLSALCLVYSGKWKHVIVAALLFAIANWIRPLAIIYILASIVYFFITKAKFYNYIALIIPYILVLFIIGTVTEKKTGYFVYQSTTSGYNLLMTAYDNADGYVNHSIYEEGNVGFIENSHLVTFAEKDSTWQSRSFKWINEHPVKYIALYFKKIFIVYSTDTWSNNSHWGVSSGLLSGMLNGSFKPSEESFIKKAIKRGSLSITYYLTMIFFFYALWINRNKIHTVKLSFLVIFITGNIITFIFPAITRYKYPFIFVIIIYAAWGIDTLIERRAMKK